MELMFAYFFELNWRSLFSSGSEYLYYYLNWRAHVSFVSELPLQHQRFCMMLLFL
jgi:hypothetical protein